MGSEASVQKHQGLESGSPALAVSTSSERSTSDTYISSGAHYGLTLLRSASNLYLDKLCKRRAVCHLYAVGISRCRDSTAGWQFKVQA
jgi:hypothetical protein